MSNGKNAVREAEVKLEKLVEDVIQHSTYTFEPQTVEGKKLKHFMSETLPSWLYRNIRYVFVTWLVLMISIYSYIKIDQLTNEIFVLKSENGKQIALNSEISSQKVEIEKLQRTLEMGSFVMVNRNTLLNDLKNRFYSMSPEIANRIVDTIISEAKKYNMNPLVLYSVGSVESSHRFWLEHDKVKIDVDGKSILARAVGWGGVMWEHHSKLLIEKGIARNRSDLFYPEANIKATAAIYNMYFNMEKKDGVNSQEVSAQRRYFGGNYKEYSDKIQEQVAILVKSEVYR